MILNNKYKICKNLKEYLYLCLINFTRGYIKIRTNWTMSLAIKKGDYNGKF